MFVCCSELASLRFGDGEWPGIAEKISSIWSAA